MAGYVFKNGAQLLPFSLLGLGLYISYIYIWDLFICLAVCYIHISNSKIERESKIKRQNKKQNI